MHAEHKDIHRKQDWLINYSHEKKILVYLVSINSTAIESKIYNHSCFKYNCLNCSGFIFKRIMNIWKKMLKFLKLVCFCNTMLKIEKYLKSSCLTEDVLIHLRVAILLG